MAGKKGCLGCSFPLIIILAIVLIGLIAFGFIGGALGRELFGDLGMGFLHIEEPHPELAAETVWHQDRHRRR